YPQLQTRHRLICDLGERGQYQGQLGVVRFEKMKCHITAWRFGWQVYGIGGELIAVYAANVAPSSAQKEYGYRNGQLLITATAASSGGGWGAPPSYTGSNPLSTCDQIKLENLS